MSPQCQHLREDSKMSTMRLTRFALRGLLALTLAAAASTSFAEQQKPASYAPVLDAEPFADVLKRMSAAKEGLAEKQSALLEERYDLRDAPSKVVTMTRSKAVQGGIRVKLPNGMTWEALGKMTPDEIKKKD